MKPKAIAQQLVFWVNEFVHQELLGHARTHLGDDVVDGNRLFVDRAACLISLGILSSLLGGLMRDVTERAVREELENDNEIFFDVFFVARRQLMDVAHEMRICSISEGTPGRVFVEESSKAIAGLVRQAIASDPLRDLMIRALSDARVAKHIFESATRGQCASS